MSMEDLRKQIDRIDEELLSLLNRRAECALRIGEEKRRVGAPLLDPGRETHVLARVKKLNGGPLSPAQVGAIYAVIMKECAGIQAQPARTPAGEARVS